MGLADIKARLSKAIHGLNMQLATGVAAQSSGAPGGALIQVWMPNQLPDGTKVLSAQVTVCLLCSTHA